MQIKIVCDSCDGSGVYFGANEPEGVGVVCWHCRGLGFQKVEFSPFTSRKLLTTIKIVRLPQSAEGGEISYEKFLERYVS